MGSLLIASLRLCAFVIWTAVLIPVQALAVALRWKLAERVPMLFHRGCLRILGIDVVVRGTLMADRPVLFVSNHCSYLDVTTLGAVLPGCFVAKSEVRNWPLFGYLAKLQRSVFVERKARTSVERQRDTLTQRLEDGDSLILFPEGTSSDGNRTLPFKSALFAVAAARPQGRVLPVQPVSLAATKVDGLPMGLADRPLYAWYGDMELAPHLWGVFRAGRITVEIDLHPPVTLEAFGSRKALADHCWQVISRGMARSLSGRVVMPPAPGDGEKAA